MLKRQRRFSFETVFSHPSNLDTMRQAVNAGYKVYLYFVSTESPAINKYRVQLRVAQNGHDVPGDKIESRYYRSMELLYEQQNSLIRFSFLIIPHKEIRTNSLIILKNKATKRYGIFQIKENSLNGLKSIIGTNETIKNSRRIKIYTQAHQLFSRPGLHL